MTIDDIRLEASALGVSLRMYSNDDQLEQGFLFYRETENQYFTTSIAIAKAFLTGVAIERARSAKVKIIHTTERKEGEKNEP